MAAWSRTDIRSVAKAVSRSQEPLQGLRLERIGKRSDRSRRTEGRGKPAIQAIYPLYRAKSGRLTETTLVSKLLKKSK